MHKIIILISVCVSALRLLLLNRRLAPHSTTVVMTSSAISNVLCGQVSASHWVAVSRRSQRVTVHRWERTVSSSKWAETWSSSKSSRGWRSWRTKCRLRLARCRRRCWRRRRSSRCATSSAISTCSHLSTVLIITWVAAIGGPVPMITNGMENTTDFLCVFYVY